MLVGGELDARLFCLKADPTVRHVGLRAYSLNPLVQPLGVERWPARRPVAATPFLLLAQTSPGEGHAAPGVALIERWSEKPETELRWQRRSSVEPRRELVVAGIRRRGVGAEEVRAEDERRHQFDRPGS